MSMVITALGFQLITFPGFLPGSVAVGKRYAVKFVSECVYVGGGGVRGGMGGWAGWGGDGGGVRGCCVCVSVCVCLCVSACVLQHVFPGEVLLIPVVCTYTATKLWVMHSPSSCEGDMELLWPCLS